jgi:16S rRNA (adenine1518-N6/adenine1519-N6)-dimethyltransferase
MINLCSPRSVQQLLAAHGLKPSKSLGQNFLIDANYLDKIVAAAAISPSDTVLEVGPGLGTLTRALAERAGRVLAIEKDRRLQPVLAEVLAGLPVEVFFTDALQVDYAQLLSGATQPKVVANLPYYVTTPLMVNLLLSGIRWERLVFLVQRELIERIAAQPGNKSYGLLSIVTQFFSTPKLIATVPPRAFYPAPKVESAVVQLLPLDVSSHGLRAGVQQLVQVARAALAQRRKTLLNALAARLPAPREDLQQAIADLGWSPDRRGETLSVSELVALTNRIAGDWSRATAKATQRHSERGEES